MVLDHIEIIKPKPEQNYLTEFIKQIKQILQDSEQFEICDTKLDNNNNSYSPKPLNLHVTEWIKAHINDMEYAQFEDELWIIEFVNTLDESFTNSSREACRDSKESSISSSTCSNNTSILSSPCASPKSLSCSNREFEELVFVNLNADYFSKAIGSLESSKPVNSSFNKKKSNKAKLILAMLMSGAHIRNDFDPSYMFQSIQKLLEEIGYITLQVHNENLIAQIYDFTYSPIKVKQILIDVLIPVRSTVRIGLAILWNAESLIRFLKIDANFELLINRLDNKAPLESLISREKFYQKFIHLKLFEILARWSAIQEPS
ncbi:30228_t:CDS:2 [Gigaspora margarita]|uniref:30228_t:CDS:1 n=1 Tax=Gigaspora margarita TaxID=4874 RepID=A0ABN7W497_GIGMA|nr:30228_t:CDS:2 [Gigaspora margarita]